MIAPEFPRVEIPGVEVDPEVRERLDEGQAQLDHVHSERQGMLIAMLRLGYKPARSTRTKRRPNKTTKHVRHMRRLALRSQRLVEAA